MAIKKLDDIQKSFNYSMIAVMCFILIFSSTILIFLHRNIDKKDEQINQQKLTSGIEEYKFYLAESLGIIASSPEFVDYINSGRDTRNRLYTDLLSQMIPLKAESIIGMRIISNHSEILLNYGDTSSPYYVEISLCYLNDTLNNKIGYCGFYWKLYFSKEQFINNLLSRNKDLTFCKNCSAYNLLGGKNFGRFIIHNTSDMSANIGAVREKDRFLYTYLALIFFIIAAISIWYWFKIRNNLNKFIGKPLKELTLSLEKNRDISLPEENKIVEIKYLVDKIENWKAQVAEYESQKAIAAIGKVAIQVAHDIKSPLVVLNTVEKEIATLPEDTRNLFRNAIARINDIANNLLISYRDKEKFGASESQFCSEPVFLMLDMILSEKRAEYLKKEVEIILEVADGCYGLCCKVSPIDFKRSISNLVNNAVEAVNDNGKVTIMLYQESFNIIIEMTDNGCGITEKDLHDIIENGKSVRKASGSGLGLTYAIRCIKQWGGDYKIASQKGKGTEFKMILPHVNPPSWFVEDLEIISGSSVAILDDDDFIHKVWEDRLQEYKKSGHINIYHAKNLEGFLEIKNILNKKESQNLIFLMDYDISNENTNGLKIMLDESIESKSVLVTSRYEAKAVREIVRDNQIKILPKMYVPHIKIILKGSENDAEYVLIDDDKNLRNLWLLSAKNARKKLLVFSSVEEFKACQNKFSPEVMIYIDSDLKDIMRGEEFARVLYAEGFENIYLATGYSREHFGNLFWIKDIVDKHPPF